MPTEQGAERSAEAPITMHVDLGIQGEWLNVRYRVTNPDEQSIFLFNKLWAWDKWGDYVAPPSAFYACLNEDDQLHLVHGVLPLPTQAEVEVRVIPFATEVDPGQSFEQRYDIPLPVAEYNPYYPAQEESRTDVRQAQCVHISLHWLRASDELTIRPALLPGAVVLDHPRFFSRLETMHAGSIAPQLPVAKRLDAFDRF